MKTVENLNTPQFHQLRWWAVVLVLGVLTLPLAALAVDSARTFGNPDEAAAALSAAVKAKDPAALKQIFGPSLAEIENPDRVQATNEFRAFAAALDEKVRIVRESNSQCVLEVGTNYWPFPIPIVQRDGRWFFDTAAGKQEILNRRIGKNELEVLEVMRAYVTAQREYASRDRDGDDVLEYAQKLNSTPGLHDGLYWPPDSTGELSPMGPLVAEAQGEGYRFRKEDEGPQPFHGYYFKILTSQGKHAPGGKYSYIVNGNMIAGFALVAWPAEYRESGVMTFMVNQQGWVMQKDLGSKTPKVVAGIKTYDPDSTWARSPD